MREFLARILNRFNYKSYGDYLKLVNVLSQLGVRVNRGGEIIEILNMDEEAVGGRMWHDMTTEQHNMCRKVWREYAN